MKSVFRHANAKEKWSALEDKLLAATWGPDVDVKALSEELGRSREAIEVRARVLGLKRKLPDQGTA